MDTGRTIGKDGEAVLIIVFITTGLEVYLDFAFFECSGCVSGDGCIEIQALASSIRSIVGHSKVRQVREMDTITALRTRILRLCEERKLTINYLATISALPPSSIKNILYGKSRNPKLLTIKMMCDGLGITLGEFFSTLEFDGLEQEIQ